MKMQGAIYQKIWSNYMNTEELNNIKDSSTKAFTAMAKNLYITGIRIYK